MITTKPPRVWRVTPKGEATAMSEHEALQHMRVPDQVSAAYDILTDDGYPPDKAAEIAFTAYRSWLARGRTGRDAEAFARHFVSLRRAVR